MITAAQIRGARAMTGLTLEQLAQESQLSVSQIETIETDEAAGDGQAKAALCAALERHGVQFLANGSQDGGGIGVRLQRTHDDDGTRPENLNAANDD